MKKEMGILQARFTEITPADLLRLELEGKTGIVNGDAQKAFVLMNAKPFFPEMGEVNI
jgi:hypothetical protein